ncbi:MAG: pantoate--beta-alanine ligase [Dokdonella sp.]
MQRVSTVVELRERLAALRGSGARVGFVPTMGNLHAGHYSLIEEARRHAEVVVASVFVNPTQFGPNEDFARYPRTLESDADGLAAAGCNLMFVPDSSTIYPFGPQQSVRVQVPVVSETLDGTIRPGHFDGVASVVARLFNLVQPDIAVFGRKDYQQLLVIRRMVDDLAFPIRIIGAPIVREANGLAMSSRNQYLTPDQHEHSAAIFDTLSWMKARHDAGDASGDIESAALLRLRDIGFNPDYATIRNAADLNKLPAGHTGQRIAAVALIAASLGETRLIDNLELPTTNEMGV